MWIDSTFHEPQDRFVDYQALAWIEVHGPNARENREGALHEPGEHPTEDEDENEDEDLTLSP